MHIDPATAFRRLEEAGHVFTPLLAHGTLKVEFYKPHDRDLQQPHDRGEIYVVIAGEGTFRNGVVLHPFGPGDVIFVPAGVVHRLETFTPDFPTWVFFSGPPGGEHP